MMTMPLRLGLESRIPLGTLLAVSLLVALVSAPATASPTSPEPTFSPAPNTSPNDGVRILVIGDSITGNPGCWRSVMWRDATNAGFEIDMVGTRQVDECGGLTNSAGATWDPDNTGISGITVAGMYVRIGREGLMERTQPDMVVAMLGTNDLLGGSDAEYILGQYDLLVDLIRKHMPEGPIVIAAPPPLSEGACPGCQAHIDAIETALPAWAEAKSSPESPVAVVVHMDGFDPVADTHDGIHPTATGEEKIAEAVSPVVLEMLAAQAALVAPANDLEPPDTILPTHWSGWVLMYGPALLVALGVSAWLLVAAKRKNTKRLDATSEPDPAPRD